MGLWSYYQSKCQILYRLHLMHKIQLHTKNNSVDGKILWTADLDMAAIALTIGLFCRKKRKLPMSGYYELYWAKKLVYPEL